MHGQQSFSQLFAPSCASKLLEVDEVPNNLRTLYVYGIERCYSRQVMATEAV